MTETSATAEFAQLAAKIEQVRQERARLESRAASLAIQIAALRRSEAELANELYRARIQPTTTNVFANKLPTRRSLGVWKAWAALDRAFAESGDRSGLPNDAAQQAILTALPGAPPNTLRSYLHRFKQQGLIKRVGNRWQPIKQPQDKQSHSADGGGHD